jgi:uncharacterized protein YecT (DUF1311 family)
MESPLNRSRRRHDISSVQEGVRRMGAIERAVAMVVAAAVLLLSVGSFQAAPSSDCRRAATVVEQQFCRTPYSGDLDRDIAQLYVQALDALSPADADASRADQRLWLKVRDECNDYIYGNAGMPSDVEGCLADRMYTEKSHLQNILTSKKFSK